MIIAVTIESEHAHLYSEDRAVDMRVPASLMRRRMGDAKKAFFSAEVKRDQLEIGERADWQSW